MGFLNPSFATSGPNPGEAEGWTFKTRVQREAIAGFGDPAFGYEDFERWYAFNGSLPDRSLTRAFFDSAPKGFESFEVEWVGVVYLRELPPAALVPAPFPGPVDNFEWPAPSFLWAWSEVASVQAAFSPSRAEPFSGWHGSYVTRFEDLTAATAVFQGGLNHEPFDSGFETSDYL